jgi:hypothetical protein
MPISSRPSRQKGGGESMKVIIALALALVLVAQNVTAAELTPDQRAKLDRYIEDKTRQVCTDQQKGGANIESDECFTNMKPLIQRDLEDAFQTFQQWQAESEQEQQQSGDEQQRPRAKQTFSSGDAIRHCGPQGCQ